jgi:hypothetical protein
VALGVANSSISKGMKIAIAKKSGEKPFAVAG